MYIPPPAAYTNTIHNFIWIGIYNFFILTGSPTDRKISFAVFGQIDKTDSAHSSATSLSFKDDDNRSSCK